MNLKADSCNLSELVIPFIDAHGKSLMFKFVVLGKSLVFKFVALGKSLVYMFVGWPSCSGGRHDR
jgi:hypothetical protein